MSVQVAIEGGDLLVTLRGLDRVLAMKGSLRFPLARVRGVAVSDRKLVPHTGFRLPGTSLPGVIRAGSYGTGAARDFWLVRRAAEVLVIELEPGQPYRRLILELDDPQAVALALRPTVGSVKSAAKAVRRE